MVTCRWLAEGIVLLLRQSLDGLRLLSHLVRRRNFRVSVRLLELRLADGWMHTLSRLGRNILWLLLLVVLLFLLLDGLGRNISNWLLLLDWNVGLCWLLLIWRLLNKLLYILRRNLFLVSGLLRG